MGSWKDLFIVAFLGLQLLIPIRGAAFLWDKTDTRGNFSWNMYSRRYKCQTRYLLLTEDGVRHPYAYKQHFRSRKGHMKVFHRDHLPKFHEWLCAELATQDDFWDLEASVQCSLNEGPWVTLVPDRTRVCTAPNYGVQ